MKTKLLLGIMGFLLIYIETASADLILNDGNVHNFPPLTASETVVVQDGPGGNPTTVNLSDTGLITGLLIGQENSEINITGGSVVDRVIIGGASGAGTADISGGTIGRLETHGTSIAIMTGGTIAANTNISGAVTTATDSTLTITGGIINGALRARQNSTLNIEGGNYSAESISSAEDSNITILGSVFNLPFGSYDADSVIGYGKPSFNLTGILADGSVLNTRVSTQHNAKLTLLPVPEPSLGLLLGISLVGLVGVGAVRKIKQKKVANS